VTALSLIVIAVLTLAATWAATFLVRRWLMRLGVFDHPNERSSHVKVTPRGGGIAVVAVVLLAWVVIPNSSALILAPALVLAIVSLVDDLKGLPPGLRLGAHAAAVAVGLLALPATVFQGALPFWLDRAAAALLWIWFVNLYNFMDGIDGITGVETAVIGIGVTALALALGTLPVAALHGASLAGAALGFLLWNWHPARIFLGDVGSVALGFLLGWLLLDLAARGFWAAALLLPLYHLADATWTLGRRALRRERVWQAHRSHFYQRATQVPADHARVSRLIALHGFAMIGCALWSLTAPLAALAVGGILTALLLFWFGRAQSV
jgi:UDP-N-acetylmuramyl pentapeptide phosphotransferase/UDP-N-acetylglucosamine-1-phosphate transferase